MLHMTPAQSPVSMHKGGRRKVCAAWFTPESCMMTFPVSARSTFGSGFFVAGMIPSGITGRGGARRGDNTGFFTIADERKKERDGRRFCTGKRYHTEKEKLL